MPAFAEPKELGLILPGASLPALFNASAGSIQLTVATIVDVINIAVKHIIESIVLVITFPIPRKILKIDHRFHYVIPYGNSVSELFFGKDENKKRSVKYLIEAF